MKKVLLAALFCVFAITANSYASIIMFDSIGLVDPNFNNTWNPATLTGTARYYFSYDNPSVRAFWLSIQFEGDVFDLGQLDAGDVNVVNPGYWFDSITSETGFEYARAFGWPINSTQDPIVVDVNYKLLGDPNTLNWDEGQVWSQAYSMLGVGVEGCGIDLAVSGGSTAPVPEPATMSLLGFGILGLFGLRKRT